MNDKNCIWTSSNGKYRIVKNSDTAYALYIDRYEINIWMDDGEFVSNELYLVEIPKYVRQAVKKFVGDVI